MNRVIWRGLLLASVAISTIGGVAKAQSTSPSSGTGEADIIVTARKRAETSLAVPVVLTAVGATELQRRAINSLDGIARIVPSLIIGEGGNTQQGGVIAIRGIGGADTNNLGDQAVSFNIDGVQIARASVRRMAQMDIQQVEILKGPQALFYGKNSPAGIISVRSADPTDALEAKLSTGYEFVAHEIRSEGYVSGPLTDSLGARLALYGSHMRGWIKNTVPQDSIYAPKHPWQPRTDEYAGRLTLKYDPSDSFNARLKVAYSHVSGDSPASVNQIISCPVNGVPQQQPSVDDCTANNRSSTGDVGPNFSLRDPRFKQELYMMQRQILAGLEMNYQPSGELTFTSVTGYYDTLFNGQSNSTISYVPATIQPSRFHTAIREFTQELRVTSLYDGPINFTMGAFYQNAHGNAFNLGYVNAINPTPIASAIFFYGQNTNAYSAFGQLRWDIVPRLELAVGGRYSKERKTLPVHKQGTPEVQVPVPVDEADFNDFSPEITLSYRPSSTLTMFGSYRRGFLSGGFNTGGPVPAATALPSALRYNQEIVKGFETGVKALLLDGTLRLNLAAYTYEVKGLQLSVTTNNTVVELRNAGSARDKGVEFDFNYRSPLPGLTLNGGVAYTHARYTQYIASCYRGQPRPACQPRLNPTSGLIALSQDLKGGQLLRAPDWTGNIGFNYEQPIGSDWKLGLSANTTFSSGFFTDAASNPFARQPSYQLLDATLRVLDSDERWEVALIGRNLTDKYYITRSGNVPFTGTPAGGPAADNFPADPSGAVNRGREVMVRLSFRFGSR